MSSFNPGNMMKQIRERKKLNLQILLRGSSLNAQTMSRAENSRQTPRDGTLHSYLTEVEMNEEDYFCPYLQGVSSNVYQMRNQLLKRLDEPDERGAIEEAGEIIERLERVGRFKKGINLQFLLSCKARYNEITEGDPFATFNYITRGLALTYPELKIEEYSDNILIFEEAELLHTYALVLKRTGNMEKAIDLLTKIKTGLAKLPEDDKEKDKRLAKVLLTLSGCLIASGDFANAQEACNEGNEASLKHSKGKYTPGFLYHKAICLFRMGRTVESKEAFTLAYFGYSLFHQKAQADSVRREAYETAGFTINTYGVDKLALEPIDYSAVYDGTTVAYSSIGAMFSAWREQAGLRLTELSCGICDKSYLQKIECNEIKQPSVYILEALAERLGRDHSLYFNTFVSPRTFKEKQMRNEILALLILQKFKEAEILLVELEKSKDYQKGINLQFIMNAKASILSKGIECNEQYFNIVSEAIELTIPNFNEKYVDRYRLTHIEKLLINKLASYYGNNGDWPRAIKIMEKLIENINEAVIDESEWLRSMGSFLYNYSRKLGKLNRFDEEFKLAEEGIKISVNNRRLISIPGLYINKGSAVYHLYDKEDSIPYYVLAYYGSAIVNNIANQNNVAEFLKSNFEIVLS